MNISELVDKLYHIHYLLEAPLTKEERDEFTNLSLNRVYYDPRDKRKSEAIKILREVIDQVSKEYITRVPLPENVDWQKVVVSADGQEISILQDLSYKVRMTLQKDGTTHRTEGYFLNHGRFLEELPFALEYQAKTLMAYLRKLEDSQ